MVNTLIKSIVDAQVALKGRLKHSVRVFMRELCRSDFCLVEFFTLGRGNW